MLVPNMPSVKIPSDLFKRIEKLVPLSSVDVMVLIEGKIILTKRRITPYRGYWHLPGSIILKGERVIDAVHRSVREELGIEVKDVRFVNYYEMFSRIRHYITHLFVARYGSGNFKLDFQSSGIRLVRPDRIPSLTIPAHKLEIKDAMKISNSNMSVKSL